MNRNFLALFHAVVDPHARTRWCGITLQRPGVGEEARPGIFSVHTDFNGVASDAEVVLGKRQWVPLGNANLLADQIDVGNALGHGMLHLEARIHFQEIIPHLVIEQEFHGAGPNVIAAFGHFNGAVAHGLAQFGCQDG